MNEIANYYDMYIPTTYMVIIRIFIIILKVTK